MENDVLMSGRYSRLFMIMALMLLTAALIVRGCNLPKIDSSSLAVDNDIREYLNNTYEAEGAGVSMMGRTRLLITLVNPEANTLAGHAAQELVAREIARYVLANQEGLPELEDVRVKFDTRIAAGSPVLEEIIFDFGIDEFQ
jgi:hypothetical protein